mmetsp:Transcript_42304/g.79151  ORF Transcript_42304/g.79151 Transcript_42304/m.79151 type:complete len:253 (+) Transcript_42304:1993-2751(+)
MQSLRSSDDSWPSSSLSSSSVLPASSSPSAGGPSTGDTTAGGSSAVGGSTGDSTAGRCSIGDSMAGGSSAVGGSTGDSTAGRCSIGDSMARGSSAGGGSIGDFVVGWSKAGFSSELMSLGALLNEGLWFGDPFVGGSTEGFPLIGDCLGEECAGGCVTGSSSSEMTMTSGFAEEDVLVLVEGPGEAGATCLVSATSSSFEGVPLELDWSKGLPSGCEFAFEGGARPAPGGGWVFMLLAQFLRKVKRRWCNSK